MTATDTVALDRAAVRDLYDEHVALLDAGELEAWLDLFVDDCDYRVVSRENADLGLPLATVRCESRAMLADRVSAIESTQFFAPRQVRRFVSGIRVAEGGRVSASFLVVETVEDDPTRIHCTGAYRDMVTAEGGRLRFVEKVAVYDAALVPTSLILPI